MINNETTQTVTPIQEDPDRILALVDLIFLCADDAKTVPS